MHPTVVVSARTLVSAIVTCTTSATASLKTWCRVRSSHSPCRLGTFQAQVAHCLLLPPRTAPVPYPLSSASSHGSVSSLRFCSRPLFLRRFNVPLACVFSPLRLSSGPPALAPIFMRSALISPVFFCSLFRVLSLPLPCPFAPAPVSFCSRDCVSSRPCWCLIADAHISSFVSQPLLRGLIPFLVLPRSHPHLSS